MLELSVYQDIPHLLAPVVTDMKQAASALNWCVAEMERRYKLMSWLGVRQLSGYNAKVAEADKAGRPIQDPTTRAILAEFTAPLFSKFARFFLKDEFLPDPAAIEAGLEFAEEDFVPIDRRQADNPPQDLADDIERRAVEGKKRIGGIRAIEGFGAGGGGGGDRG